MAFWSWSKWFERAILQEHGTPARLAVMAWIIAHASSEGSGFSVEDDASRAVIAEETGLPVAEVAAAIKFLKEHGYLAMRDRGVGTITELCAVLPTPARS